MYQCTKATTHIIHFSQFICRLCLRLWSDQSFGWDGLNVFGSLECAVLFFGSRVNIRNTYLGHWGFCGGCVLTIFLSSSFLCDATIWDLCDLSEIDAIYTHNVCFFIWHSVWLLLVLSVTPSKPWCHQFFINSTLHHFAFGPYHWCHWCLLVERVCVMFSGYSMLRANMCVSVHRVLVTRHVPHNPQRSYGLSYVYVQCIVYRCTRNIQRNRHACSTAQFTVLPPTLVGCCSYYTTQIWATNTEMKHTCCRVRLSVCVCGICVVCVVCSLVSQQWSDGDDNDSMCMSKRFCFFFQR